jgi:hypothetical protein
VGALAGCDPAAMHSSFVNRGTKMRAVITVLHRRYKTVFTDFDKNHEYQKKLTGFWYKIQIWGKIENRTII